MSEADTSKDESAYPHTKSPTSMLSPTRPGTITMSHGSSVNNSGRGTRIQSQAILEVPEVDENFLRASPRSLSIFYSPTSFCTLSKIRVGHDVHEPNLQHCLCHTCNHPCAHLCKLPQSKHDPTKGRDVAHMCHFSHKPHGKLCCGGDQLIYEDVIRSPRKSMAVSSKEIRRLSRLSNGGGSGRKSSSHSSERRRRLSNNRSHREVESRRPSSVPPPVSSPAQDKDDDDDDILEDNDGNEHNHMHNGLKRRTGSDLSVSSLPSNISPVEVFIARGALTDESGADTDLETCSQYSYTSLGPNNRVSDGFKSLVLCLVPGMKNSNEIKKRYRRRNHKLIRDKIAESREKRIESCSLHPPPPPSACSSNSRSRSQSYRHRGLSTTPELYGSVDSVSSDSDSGDEGKGTNNSSEFVAERKNIESKNEDEGGVGDEIVSRKGHLTFNQVKSVDLFIPTQIVTPPSPQPSERFKSSSSFLTSPALQDECLGSSSASSSNKIIEGEGERSDEISSILPTSTNMNHSKIESSTSKYRAIDPWTFEKVTSSAPSTSTKPPAPQPPSTSSSLHHSLTGERRELESRNTTKSPSDHSNCSLLFSPDVRRRKKGRAPRPPKFSAGSSTCSVDTNSFGSPATSNVTIGTGNVSSLNCHRKRRSLKNKPAPHPPLPKALLTRSMSEQRQLNVKHRLNADPSFRSAVNLDQELRKRGGSRQRVNTEDDSEDFSLNFDYDDERVAIASPPSDVHNSSCFPLFDQVPPDLQLQAMNSSTSEVIEEDSHLPVFSSPSSLLISFSPQPASTLTPAFRDASVQVSSVKESDPPTADNIKKTDEDERGNDEKRDVSSEDDDDE